MRFAILLAAALLSESVSPIPEIQFGLTARRMMGEVTKAERVKRNTYESERWGISFQYPDTYTVDESNAAVRPQTEWRPGLLNDGHPGEVQLVTIQIPNELFPKTDLTQAIFGLSANQHLTRDECAASVSGEYRTVSTLIIDHVEFHWSGGADAPSATGFKDYAGFANGTCYEIEIAVVTTRFGPPEGTSQVDQAELDRRMNEILHSIKTRSPTNVPSNTPSIRAFTLEALSPPSPPSSYRLSWDVAGAADGQVTIDMNCFTDVSLVEVSDLQSHDVFRCGELREVSASKGSLDLSFANHTEVLLQPQMRLLAAGREPVSKTLEISLPTMAVIRGLTLRGRDLNNGPYVQLYPGQNYVLHGAAFMPNEKVWIGETSVPATAIDERHVEFSAPSDLTGERVRFYVEDARGKSNILTARVVRVQPRISFYVSADASPMQSREMRNGPVVPGQRIRVVGAGFTSHNTVWIGSTNAESEPDDRLPQFEFYFTIPNSLSAGTYPFWVTNDLGKSNEITLTLSTSD